ncbi:MAG TPA: MFS transporter [Planctomycetota bacterium]|nr:MFS transporter [Planctomycetota bacterium]
MAEEIQAGAAEAAGGGGAGRKHGRSALGAIALTVIVDLVGFGIVLPLLPRYARDFKATPSELGMLMASFSAMQFLFAPLWGRLSDRVGRRPVLLVGLAGSVAFYTLFGLAFLLGQGRAGLFWLFASRIGAGVCGATISIAAALSLVSFLWTMRSVPEPERHAATERKVFDFAAFQESLATTGMTLLLGLSFLSVFSFSNFEGTLALMLEDRFSYKEKERGWVFLFIGVTLSVAQGMLVRKLVPKYGERAFVRFGFACMAVGLAGVAWTERLDVLLLSLAIAVTGFGAVTPSLSSLISRRIAAERQGSVMGLAQSVSALGRIAGPWVGNLLYGIEPAAHPRPFWLAAGILGVLALLSSRVPAAADAPSLTPGGPGAA